MRIMISTDMEGLSGVDDPRQCHPPFPEEYAQGRKFLMHEINAVVKGLRSAGAPEIDVIDLHSDGINVIPEMLEPGVTYLGGCEKWIDMMQKGEMQNRYDGWIQLGMHSMPGTLDGYMSHTNGTNAAIKNNGRFIGEIEEFAWSAGHFGIPTLFVAGDDAATREAEVLLPGVKTVVVKKSSSRNETHCLPLEETASLLEKAAADALINIDSAKVYTIPDPIKVEVMFANSELAYFASCMPKTEMTDEKTIAYSAKGYYDAIRFILTAIPTCSPIADIPLMEKLNRIEQVQKVTQDYYEEWWNQAWQNQV